MKLLTYLQTFQGFARRKAVQAIKDGFVLVNDKRVENYQMEINKGDKLILNLPGQMRKEVTVQGFKTEASQLVAFHKPIGYVVSKSDPHNQTIYFLLPDYLQSYDYIGRLDKDSSGLLLLTNDKKKVHQLGHPSSGLIKTYVVRVDSELSLEEIEKAKKGMMVDEEGNEATREEQKANNDRKLETGNGKPESSLLKFVSVKQEQMKGYVELTIKLVEGHKRHIRRLLKALGKKIYALHRIAFGDYVLGGLKEGKCATATVGAEKKEQKKPKR